MKKAVFCWSGGKDSALALEYTLHSDEYTVMGLITTLNSNIHRISMHGIDERLLDEQAASIGLPLYKVMVGDTTNDAYEAATIDAFARLRQNLGITHVIFGDIHLEEVRKYREKILTPLSLEAVFPLWHLSPLNIIQEFIDKDFKTIVCCVDEAVLDSSFAGRIIDAAFIDDLPESVDACGENGEYHTFCFDGPIFSYCIPLQLTGLVRREIAHCDNIHHFCYADLALDEMVEA